MAGNSFGARAGLDVGDRSLEVFRLDALASVGDVGGLPFSLKVLLENLLRNEDGSAVTAEDVEAFARWDPAAAEDREIAFSPARVLMQDFTGVPADRRPGRHARRHGRPRRRPDPDQPAGPGRAGHRPLGGGRLRRAARRLRPQRRAGVRAQPGALRVPALGPAGLRRLQGRAPGHRHLPPGQLRVPGQGGVRQRQPARPTPTPWSAPTPTPRWSTASACSAGASAASRPRRPCSASRSRC